ncbi:MAG: hypothetical protein IKR69_04940 [Bacteroidales bacterium]|nr:hypothetical protein [Bacteroidales bacterium]
MEGKIKRIFLYFIAAFIWGVPGFILTIKGVRAYSTMPAQKIWWLLLITVFVLGSFFFMFRGIVDRYSRRISSLPDKVSPLQTFPLRGWILIICMTSLGLVLKLIPLVPAEFTASFYSGLGPMLIWAAYRFVRNGIRQ